MFKCARIYTVSLTLVSYTHFLLVVCGSACDINVWLYGG